MKGFPSCSGGVFAVVLCLLGMVSLTGAVPAELNSDQQGVLKAKTDHYAALGYEVLTAGEFPDVLFGFESGKKYVVIAYPLVDEWYLPPGRSAEMSQGTKIFLEPLVRLRIAGTLVSVYTDFEIVPKKDLFQADSVGRKQWSGILLEETGRIHFDGVSLSGAKTVLDSRAPYESLTLECINVAKADSCPVKVQDSCLTPRQAECFYFDASLFAQGLTEDAAPGTKPASTANGRLTEKHSLFRSDVLQPWTKWGALSMGILSAGLVYASHHFQQQALEARTRTNDAVTRTEVEAAMSETDDNLGRRDAFFASAVLSGLLAAGLGVTFYYAF